MTPTYFLCRSEIREQLCRSSGTYSGASVSTWGYCIWLYLLLTSVESDKGLIRWWVTIPIMKQWKEIKPGGMIKKQIHKAVTTVPTRAPYGLLRIPAIGEWCAQSIVSNWEEHVLAQRIMRHGNQNVTVIIPNNDYLYIGSGVSSMFPWLIQCNTEGRATNHLKK
jgi:hypothetical protein